MIGGVFQWILRVPEMLGKEKKMKNLRSPVDAEIESADPVESGGEWNVFRKLFRTNQIN